jgi:hypothetical protein
LIKVLLWATKLLRGEKDLNLSPHSLEVTLKEVLEVSILSERKSKAAIAIKVKQTPFMEV